MNVLVTGITGYVGAVLVPRLLREGHSVRGLSRHTTTAVGGVSVLRGDAVSGEGLAEALDGVQVAYFLIHSMEPVAGGNGTFGDRERVAAENFGRAAQAAGVERVIYLGGLVPKDGPVSPHLKSRLAVEEVLLSAVPDSVAFRASIAIGARSRSFRFLVRLVERMPVLTVPAWHGNRTTPIDERDMVEFMVQAATNDRARGRSFDIGGPDVVSYGELIDRIRDLMLVDRPIVSFRRLSVTPIAGRIASAIAGEEYELIGPLMESLETDLLPRDNSAVETFGLRLHSLDAAIEHALREWESVERLAAR